MKRPIETIAPKDMPERNSIQVIGRAVAVLRALEGVRDGLNLAELAERTGLARSTVQRIVKALSDEQLLMAGTLKARVKLGPLLVRLGASVKLDVVEIARPLMQDLSRTIDETVDLSVLNGNTALFVEHVVGTQRLAAVSAIGTEFPLHSSANGKALLAAVSPTRRMGLLRGALGPPIAIRQLEQELLAAQATGITYDRDEHTLGISAVGTWFSDAVGRPFALSIPVPSVRFGTGKHLIKPMIKTRDLIVDHLGRASGAV